MVWVHGIIFFLGAITVSSAQTEERNLDKYVLTKFLSNQEDITAFVLSKDAFIAFYKEANGTIVWMRNAWPKDSTESYGPVDQIEAIQTNDKNKKHLRFRWQYYNNYDSNKGTAIVNAIFSLQPSELTNISITITTEDKKEIVIEGYKFSLNR